MNEVVVTVVGNVVSEPQTTATPGGASLTTFRLASAERRFDRETGQYRDTESLFLQVRCWKGLAVNAAATLRKGAPVIVQGRLRQRSVLLDGPEGPVRRVFVDIDAHSLGVDLARAARPAELRPGLPDVRPEAEAA